MSTTPAPAAPYLATAGRRRGRYALQTGAMLLAITASCVLLALLAARFPIRWDVTATREHRLSQRTLDLLRGLDQPYEIAVAANKSAIDPRAFQRTRDVLDTFARSSPSITVTLIDTGSSRGLSDYDNLLTRLAGRFKSQADSQKAVLSQAADSADILVEFLKALSADLLAAQDAVPAGDASAQAIRTFLNNAAARARVLGDELQKGAQAARTALGGRVAGMPIPPLDDAARAIHPILSTIATELSGLREQVLVLESSDQSPAPVRDKVHPIVQQMLLKRDLAARAAGEVDRLEKLTIITVAHTLEQTSAALIIGPPGSLRGGITAVDFNSLFPPRLPEAPGAPVAPTLDMRARTEEMLATGIASLRSTASPILVLVHDQAGRLGPEFQAVRALIDRMGLRGIDVTEWAVAVDAQRPSPAQLDPSGKRPVVYASISTAPTTAESAVRMGKLADALARLVADGKPLLLSVNVSTLPGMGDKDPLVEFLPALGLSADSGRPLMQQAQGPAGRTVLTDFYLTRATGDYPIARAIDGLRTHFFWPVALHAGNVPSGATITPLINISDEKSTWGESEWLGFARVPARQRQQIIDPPKLDSPRDDGAGPWTVAAAVERRTSGQTPTQRLVVVGCNGWFLDAVTQQASIIDGRPLLDSPGNLELLESGVYWLAGQDELIARSPAAQAVPIIRPLTGAQLSAIRWSLILGLPALVLLLGAAWRLLRG
jgi:hypothetical protein